MLHKASFIIAMRIIIYIQRSAGLCNLQLRQSHRKIKDNFRIKTKALGRLPAVPVYYGLCSSEDAKERLSGEPRVPSPPYFLGKGTSSSCTPSAPQIPPALQRLTLPLGERRSGSSRPAPPSPAGPGRAVLSAAAPACCPAPRRASLLRCSPTKQRRQVPLQVLAYLPHGLDAGAVQKGERRHAAGVEAPPSRGEPP